MAYIAPRYLEESARVN